MKIGHYDVHAIETGTFWIDGGSMFGVVPWTLWNKTNPPDERRRIELVARCLLIRGNGRTILVDDGNGDKWNSKLRDIYKLDNSKHDLLSSLKQYDVLAEDVTDILFTHLHFDHAGGTTKNVNGKLELTFPNAVHYVQKRQWELSQNPSERDHGSYLDDDLQLMEEKKVLELIEGEVELFPGIDVLLAQGHTDSQQLPRISDDKRTLLYCADLIPLVSHLQYPYIMAYDLRPIETLNDKKRILSQAFEEQWILFLDHDPRVEAITLKKTKRGYSEEKIFNIE